MTKHLGKRSSVLTATPLVRWCQERIQRLRSPGSGREPSVRYLTRAEKRATQHLLISPPDSPPPKYNELLLDDHHHHHHHLPLPLLPVAAAQSNIAQIPPDWMSAIGPPNSVLRRNFHPDENPFRRDFFVA